MNTFFNRIKLWIALFLLLFISCRTSTETTDSGKLEVRVLHPRIYWTENPQSEAIISWTSTGVSEDVSHTVWVSTSPEVQSSKENKWEFSIHEVVSGKIDLETEDKLVGVKEAYYQHASLHSLKPNTTYYFKFCSDNVCSPVYHFITAPDKGEGVKLLFGGDSRTGSPTTGIDTHPASHSARREMNTFIAGLVEKDPAILALIHGADYGMTASWWHLWYWFADHELTITKDNRVIPLIISQGNHDHAKGFYQNFMLPNIKKAPLEAYYYTTVFSKDIALITLNTEKSMAGDQLDWLEKEIKEKRAQHPWLLIQYHRPAFPAVKSFDREDFAKVRRYWVPLFEKYQADLILESDGHALKKTAPIKGEKIDRDSGIVYIGEGGLGVPQRKADPERWYFQEGGYASGHHHVWLLEFKAKQLDVKALGIKGEELVRFSQPRKH